MKYIQSTLGFLLLAAIVVLGFFFYRPVSSPTQVIESNAATSTPITSTPESNLPTIGEIQRQFDEAGLNKAGQNALIENYFSAGWYPTFLTKGDLNNDNKDDYVFYVEDTGDKHLSDDPDTQGKNRRLVILLTQSNENYQVVEGKDLPFKMYCGECGGARWISPQVDAQIATSTLRLSQLGGTTWTWEDSATFKYENNVWLKLKDSHDWFWINDYEGSREYSETTYVYTPLASGGYSISTTTQSIRGDKADKYDSGELP